MLLTLIVENFRFKKGYDSELGSEAKKLLIFKVKQEFHPSENGIKQQLDPWSWLPPKW